MCLYLDVEKTKEFKAKKKPITVWKLLVPNGINYYSPYLNKKYRHGINRSLVRPIIVDDDLGERWEGWEINEGLHFFINKSAAKEEAKDHCPVVIKKCKVEPKHIIAVGQDNDIVVTQAFVDLKTEIK